MFSNKYRVLKIITCIIVIGSACIYSGIYGPLNDITMYEATTNPEKYNGVTIYRDPRLITHVNKKEIEFKDGRQSYRGIILNDNNKLPSVNDYVSLTGIFKEGTLNITDFHIHHYRRLKIVTSLFAFIGVIIYCFIIIVKRFKEEEITN